MPKFLYSVAAGDLNVRATKYETNRTTNWNNEREKKKEEKRAFLFLEQALYLAFDLSQIDWHLRHGKVTNRSKRAISPVRKTANYDCNDLSY